MVTKEKIIDEIKRTAKENGGKALGVARFESETGIKPYDWEKFWARFGDAIQEAGFSPNQLQSAYANDFLIEKVIGLIRKLGKFPTYTDFTVARNNDPDFPNKKTFYRLGTKDQLVQQVWDYCKDRSEYEDIVELCTPILEKSATQDNVDQTNGTEMIGEVYLFKSGRYYKIGKTNDTVRRGSELRIQLPEKMDLIHSIKTDDPSGIESYWHKRFESKRMNGEWFNLTSSDVKVFKRWRKIY